MNDQLITPSLAIIDLASIYDELENSVRFYAEKENVNERVLASKNRQLSRFYKALSSLQSLRYLLVWEQADHEMISLLQSDPNLASLVIHILLSEKYNVCPAQVIFDLS